MTAGPSVRARHMKTHLASLARLAPGRAAAVRERLPPLLEATVTAAAASEWLPLELNLAFTRAVRGALDDDAYDRFFREQLLASFRTPLLQPVVEGAVAVFGLDPGSWTRLVPTAWGLVFRDCGAWAVDRAGEGRVRLALSRLPPECVADEGWPRSVGAALSSFLDLARAEGAMRLVAVDASARRADYELAWTPRGER